MKIKKVYLGQQQIRPEEQPDQYTLLDRTLLSSSNVRGSSGLVSQNGIIKIIGTGFGGGTGIYGGMGTEMGYPVMKATGEHENIDMGVEASVVNMLKACKKVKLVCEICGHYSSVSNYHNTVGCSCFVFQMPNDVNNKYTTYGLNASYGIPYKITSTIDIENGTISNDLENLQNGVVQNKTIEYNDEVFSFRPYNLLVSGASSLFTISRDCRGTGTYLGDMYIYYVQ